MSKVVVAVSTIAFSVATGGIGAGLAASLKPSASQALVFLKEVR